VDETLEPDPNLYLGTFPLFFVARSLSGKEHDSVSITDPDIGIVASSADKVVALFDLAGAEEFAEALKISKPIFSRLGTRFELFDFLVTVQRKGYEWVLFDHRLNRKGATKKRIAEVIDALKQ
jgi:hypothetical protein